MQWSAIDWRNKLIRFTPSKTKKPVTVPLHSELEAELLKKPGIGEAVMFPSLADKGTGGKHGLSGQFSPEGSRKSRKQKNVAIFRLRPERSSSGDATRFGEEKAIRAERSFTHAVMFS